jgi:hypothetical protein
MDQSPLFSDEELKGVFEKDILEVLGAKNMPQEEKQRLYEKMNQTVQDKVLLRIDSALDGASRQDWIKISTEGDRAKMEEFLRSKNINVAKMMVEEALIYKLELATLKKQAEKDQKNSV